MKKNFLFLFVILCICMLSAFTAADAAQTDVTIDSQCVAPSATASYVNSVMENGRCRINVVGNLEKGTLTILYAGQVKLVGTTDTGVDFAETGNIVTSSKDKVEGGKVTIPALEIVVPLDHTFQVDGSISTDGNGTITDTTVWVRNQTGTLYINAGTTMAISMNLTFEDSTIKILTDATNVINPNGTQTYISQKIEKKTAEWDISPWEKPSWEKQTVVQGSAEALAGFVLSNEYTIDGYTASAPYYKNSSYTETTAIPTIVATYDVSVRYTVAATPQTIFIYDENGKEIKYVDAANERNSLDAGDFKIIDSASAYQLTYSWGNGVTVSSGTLPTDSGYYIQGDTVTVKFPTDTVTREHATFLGWAETDGATTAVYTDSGQKTFSMGAANVTLYAVWKPDTGYYRLIYSWGDSLPVYDLSNNLASLPIDNTFYILNQKITIPSANFAFQRPGIALKGWTSSWKPTPLITKDAPTTLMGTANLILTAAWNQNSGDVPLTISDTCTAVGTLPSDIELTPNDAANPTVCTVDLKNKVSIGMITSSFNGMLIIKNGVPATSCSTVTKTAIVGSSIQGIKTTGEIKIDGAELRIQTLYDGTSCYEPISQGGSQVHYQDEIVWNDPEIDTVNNLCTYKYDPANWSNPAVPSQFEVADGSSIAYDTAALEAAYPGYTFNITNYQGVSSNSSAAPTAVGQYIVTFDILQNAASKIQVFDERAYRIDNMPPLAPLTSKLTLLDAAAAWVVISPMSGSVADGTANFQVRANQIPTTGKITYLWLGTTPKGITLTGNSIDQNGKTTLNVVNDGSAVEGEYPFSVTIDNVTSLNEGLLIVDCSTTPVTKQYQISFSGSNVSFTPAASQTVTSGSAITPVTVTVTDAANYVLPATVADLNGLKYSYTSQTQATISGTPTADTNYVVNAVAKTQPQPGGNTINWFLFGGENKKIPGTGFSASHLTTLREQPRALSYTSTPTISIDIPSLDVSAHIVSIPEEGNSWAADWLDEKAGLLEGSALPGQGLSVLAAHNHLNTMEVGPFLFIRELQNNDRIFIRSEDGQLQQFKVFDNELFEPDQFNEMISLANSKSNTLVLITCENESVDGGYTHRRVVFAEPI